MRNPAPHHRTCPGHVKAFKAPRITFLCPSWSCLPAVGERGPTKEMKVLRSARGRDSHPRSEVSATRRGCGMLGGRGLQAVMPGRPGLLAATSPWPRHALQTSASRYNGRDCLLAAPMLGSCFPLGEMALIRPCDRQVKLPPQPLAAKPMTKF